MIENVEDETRRKSNQISFLFGILPFVIMVGTFLLFQLDGDLKKMIVPIFTNVDNMNFQNLLIIVSGGVLLTVLSGPFLIFELCVGYAMEYKLAVVLAVFSKFCGEMVCYSISKCCLKNCLINYLRYNYYFSILERAVKKYPWKVSNMLRATILVPLFVINFGSGILGISLFQFIAPALLWGTLYSCLSVYAGSQIHQIQEVVQNSSFPKTRFLFWFELACVLFGALILGFFIYYSGKVFQQIKQEVEEEEISGKTLVLEETIIY